MDETSGTTVNDSKGSTNGTKQSGVTVNAATIFTAEGSPSMSFDGTSNAYITFGANFGATSDWTYELIFYDNGTHSNSVWTNGNYGNAGALKLNVVTGNSGTLDLSSWVNADNSKSATIPGSTPYYVVITKNGTTKTFYVNGSSIGTLTGTTDSPSGAVGYIGCGAQFGGTRTEFWNGRIAKFAVYNADIGSTAVASHYSLLTAPAGAVLRPSGMDGLHGRYQPGMEGGMNSLRQIFDRFRMKGGLLIPA